MGSGQGLLKIEPDMPKDSCSDPNEGHRSIKAPACFVNTLTVKQMPGTAGPGLPPAHIHNLLTESRLSSKWPRVRDASQTPGTFHTLVINMQTFHPNVWTECSTGGAGTAQEKHSLMLVHGLFNYGSD